MKRNFIFLIGMAVLMLLTAACKKDEGGSGTKAVFSYVADGFKVNFTNFSSNATEYHWEFNDGSNETSDKKSPQHIFRSKGDFLVTLTARNGTEESVFTDTVSIIGPNIKIDGDFTDWEYVGYTHENTGTSGGSITAIKTFASTTHINFLLEGTSDMNLEIIDLYLDADNNPATGFSTWQYPLGSGADFLFEGSLVGAWGDLFAHAGAPADFSFNPVAPFADVINTSALRTTAGKKIIEFSIKRDRLGTTRNFVNFALIEMTAGWAQVGSIPVNITAESVFGKIVL